jgi:putative transposase
MGFVKSVALRFMLAYPDTTERQMDTATVLHFHRVGLDHDGYLPTFMQITDGKVHEVNMARTLSLPKGSIVVFDRGYTD